MRAKSHDDINVQITDDPEHDQRFRGFYVLQPNSVRRDIEMAYTLPPNVTPRRVPWDGRELR